MASVCLIIAAYAVDSPYSQIGAERELVQTMAYEPMLLMVALGFYLASGSFSVGDILTRPYEYPAYAGHLLRSLLHPSH